MCMLYSPLITTQGKKRGEISSESSSSEEEDEDDNVVAPIEGAKPDDSDLFSDGEEVNEPEDDSFIVEDDSTAAVAQLPVIFSMNTHQDLAHHFKIICQLFVHLIVRPAAERREFMTQMMRGKTTGKSIPRMRPVACIPILMPLLVDEEYFAVPLQIARRKLSGLRDSLVASSVWRPEFKKPLERYPEFKLTTLDFAIPACDACNLGGRLSTRLGRLSGTPYDRLGFEVRNYRSNKGALPYNFILTAVGRI